MENIDCSKEIELLRKLKEKDLSRFRRILPYSSINNRIDELLASKGDVGLISALRDLRTPGIRYKASAEDIDCFFLKGSYTFPVTISVSGKNVEPRSIELNNNNGFLAMAVEYPGRPRESLEVRLCDNRKKYSGKDEVVSRQYACGVYFYDNSIGYAIVNIIKDANKKIYVAEPHVAIFQEENKRKGLGTIISMAFEELYRALGVKEIRAYVKSTTAAQRYAEMQGLDVVKGQSFTHIKKLA